MSICSRLLVFLSCLLFVTVVQSLDYTFKVDVSKVVTKVASPFYGFTLDWWTADDPTYGKKWGNAGALSVDLSNQNLIALVSAITPAILRIGGSPEDSIIYNNSNGACLNVSASLPGYACSQTKNNYGCLNNSRWQQINTFATQTNATLVFGVSACYGRRSSSTPMNFINIQGLLEDTVKQQTQSQSGSQNPAMSHENLYGFELGNELNGRIDADTYAKDFVTLKNMINRVFSNSASLPVLIGADVGSLSYSKDVLAGIAALTNNQASKYMAKLTYHSYPNCAYPANGGGSVFSLSCLESIHSHAVDYASAAQPYAVPVWMGEGSEHSGGGTPDVSNTYVDNFYYLYQLCEIVLYGVQSTIHSDLLGGDYELINHETFVANPDYWVLWLWRQFMGDTMYSMDLLPANSNFRGYAFNGRQAGQLVFAFINFDLKDAASIDVQISGASSTAWDFMQYNIEPVGNSLQTINIAVNGVAMQYANGKFPVLHGVSVSNPLAIKVARLAVVVATPK